MNHLSLREKPSLKDQNSSSNLLPAPPPLVPYSNPILAFEKPAKGKPTPKLMPVSFNPKLFTIIPVNSCLKPILKTILFQ